MALGRLGPDANFKICVTRFGLKLSHHEKKDAAQKCPKIDNVRSKVEFEYGFASEANGKTCSFPEAIVSKG